MTTARWTRVALVAAGLFLLAVSGVLVAVALWRSRQGQSGLWRSGARAKWAGIPLALGLVLLLPQFFGGPDLRITHGFLVAAGCVLIAVTVRDGGGVGPQVPRPSRPGAASNRTL